MGIYTHFIFDAVLKKDSPGPLLEYIQYRLTDPNENEIEEIPFDDHPFFSCQRWHWVLTWNSCNDNGFKTYCEETENGLHIHIDTSLKNYCSSIEWFLIFISPLVDLNFECMLMRDVEGCYDIAEIEDASALVKRIQDYIKLNSNKQLGDIIWKLEMK